MSSAVNIQIVSMPNLAKIESFFKDVSYRETIEYSANFNTRLCIERRLRLPFLDPQTGVAQSHSQLFMDKRQRMPGFRQGQIYTYPAARWRKSRRQYLTKMYSRFPERPFQALRKEHEALVASGIGGSNLGLPMASNTTAIGHSMLTGGGTASPVVLHNDATHDFNGAFSLEESSSLGAAGGDTSDSKDSQLQTQQQQQQQQPHQQQQQPHQSKDELPKEWFYDDMDMNDVDSLEDPKSPADDEYDYDPRYGNKKRRKRRPGKRATTLTGGDSCGGSSSTSGRRRSGVPRTRVTTTDAALDASLEAIESGDITGTPTSSGGRRSRGAGTRGRRRAKGASSSCVAGGIGGSGGGSGSGGGTTTATCGPHSPGLVNEPPSFESAAAAVGVNVGVEDGNAHLRNYRKYL
ncbi:developmental regulatory protein wetA [Scaptodrosophila lebanonensis]|uniref:Developmental regulatory protein wetA n=1 Tax=Drosophila lebanonensis TaxID=7225 RepID=A0A6J2UGT8_DROLE|nr:developmental regulatory protein wetA [Scaptodrosophila lebanonensis]XP_030386634.1 developmental regulatory protein wetA [Scaptodrosophila lebanonensis]